ncbi:MAG: Gfo/Idh/MocA family oxidoreductase [Elusimicrobia bacterium]|nr:Gfo/Idh/MocA family oxidoreductase [Elusimicrobiota bacterium]
MAGIPSAAKKGALVGFGQIAEKAHVPAFRAVDGLHIVAVAESVGVRLEAARAAWPQARLYSSFDELLESETALDFVVVATPPALHSAQALAALQRGLHVLCEKPLVLDAQALELLKKQARESDRALVPVHNWAYSPQWRQVWRWLENDAIGPARKVELEVLRCGTSPSVMPGDWRRDVRVSGGGILVDHGWHNLYLLYRILRRPFLSVAVEASRYNESGAEDELELALRFPGAEAKMRLSWRAGGRSNRARIEGDRGVIELEDDRLRCGDEATSFPEKLSAGSAHPGWLIPLLEDFKTAMDAPPRNEEGGSAAPGPFPYGQARLRELFLEEAAFCVDAIRAAYSRMHRTPASSL